MEAKGVNGTVEFDGTFVTMKRTVAIARMTVGKVDKRIPVAQITAVQWKPPSTLIRGFILFTLAGGIENKARFGKQTVNAAGDENSVVVGKTQKNEFEELREAIESQIAVRPAPPRWHRHRPPRSMQHHEIPPTNSESWASFTTPGC
jgi:hypothetical protein